MSLVCSHMLPSHTLSRRPLRTRPCQPSLAPSMPPTMLLPGRLPPAALATLTSSALGTSAALLERTPCPASAPQSLLVRLPQAVIRSLGLRFYFVLGFRSVVLAAAHG